jgi:hypothetical protein
MEKIKNYDFKTSKYSLMMFGFSVMAFYGDKKVGWIRFFGKGIKWKDTSIYSLSFSERNHSKLFKTGIQIGNFRIAVLD